MALDESHFERHDSLEPLSPEVVRREIAAMEEGVFEDELAMLLNGRPTEVVTAVDIATELPLVPEDSGYMAILRRMDKPDDIDQGSKE